MNTTADIDKALADLMRQELGVYARLARKRYEEAKAKFLADVQTSLASAEDMVKAQTGHEVWLQIEREMAEHDPREVLTENLKEAQYRVRSSFGGNSSSIFANAVERARAESYLRQVEQLESLATQYDI